MKSLFLILLSNICITTFAQVHFIGIKAGANITNVTTSNFITPNDNRNGFVGGTYV